MTDEVKEAAPVYEDLFDLPENVVGEIVDGELFASPRPAFRHARASTILGSRVGGPFDEGRGGPGGWWILIEPELHFGPNVMVPDLAGWRRQRMPSIPDVAWFDLAPDWVCEVISPSTGRLDRVKKMPAYARSGVAFLWLIDPIMKTLEIYELVESTWRVVATHGGGEIVRAVPFDAVELDLAALWID
ncbi:MAG TPA: Uma2 family endonuclease [Thermoanaerobaculia bacterium]|nr:Uma2 family endonuclease [Thermoanaerobaculia bacterium]